MLTKGRAHTGGQAQPEAPDPTVFDREHLRQYTGGDGDLERELVGLFLGQFAPMRAKLDETASAEDWKFAAHTLKGSARSIGAPRIAAVAEKLESFGQKAAATGRETVMAELDEAMAAFAAEAEKLLI